ncbi:MAG: hypothetical protein IT373_37575 [Polyangiaceae bacterium]|nr:hypothetical protein [Polyangiaceae bacterium]
MTHNVRKLSPSTAFELELSPAVAPRIVSVAAKFDRSTFHLEERPPPPPRPSGAGPSWESYLAARVELAELVELFRAGVDAGCFGVEAAGRGAARTGPYVTEDATSRSETHELALPAVEPGAFRALIGMADVGLAERGLGRLTVRERAPAGTVLRAFDDLGLLRPFAPPFAVELERPEGAGDGSIVVVAERAPDVAALASLGEILRVWGELVGRGAFDLASDQGGVAYSYGCVGEAGRSAEDEVAATLDTFCAGYDGWGALWRALGHCHDMGLRIARVEVVL